MVKVNPMTDADFDKKGGNYFDVGVHEVYIEKIKAVTPEKGSPYVEVGVLGQNDERADIRLYTSEAAAPYTIANLARIAVHNKEGEESKQKVRESFKRIDDTDKLTDKFLSNMVNMQAWILTEEDKNAPKPNGGFYLRSSLYSYEPKAPAPATVTSSNGSITSNDGALTKEDLDEIPFE